MTIYFAEEKPLSRTGSVSGNEAIDRRVFLLKSDSPYESTYTIASSSIVQSAVSGGLSLYLTTHPQNPYTFLKSFDLSQPDAKLAYEMVCNYDSKPITQEDRNRSILNPLDRPALTRWDKRKESNVSDRDANGKPKVNAAGECFDPPPEKTATIWIYRVQKNMPAPPIWLADYEDCINDSTMYIYERDGTPIYTILRGGAKLVIDDLGDLNEENGIEFYPFKFSLELKTRPPMFVSGGTPNTRDGQDPTSPVTPEGWATIGLNQGLKELDDSGNLKNMTDDDGSVLTAPYALDEDGKKITGATAADRRNAVIFLVWDDLEHKDFSVIPMI